MKNAFEIVRDFEQAVAEYTGALYCVAVNSCTNALFLCLEHHRRNGYLGFVDNVPIGKQGYVEIPKHTYLSVPMQIKHARYMVKFRDEDWKGVYQLRPFNVWDAARRFTNNMFRPVNFVNNPHYICVSFHWSKILGIQQGGAILTNDQNFYNWARRARFDGRTAGMAPKDDKITELGWHMYMSPEIAAEGLVRLMHLPKHNPDLPNDDYPDLSQLEVFK